MNEMFMSVFFFSPFLVIKMEEIEGEVQFFFMNLRYFGIMFMSYSMADFGLQGVRGGISDSEVISWINVFSF